MRINLLLIIIPLLFIPFLINNCAPLCCKKPMNEIENEEGVKKNDISNIAPGQLRVQATVLEITNKDANTSLTILIDKIIEYGSASLPLAIGSRINVSVNAQAQSEQIQNNDIIDVVMRNRPIEPGNDSNTNWEILRLKK